MNSIEPPPPAPVRPYWEVLADLGRDLVGPECRWDWVCHVYFSAYDGATRPILPGRSPARAYAAARFARTGHPYADALTALACARDLVYPHTDPRRYGTEFERRYGTEFERPGGVRPYLEITRAYWPGGHYGCLPDPWLGETLAVARNVRSLDMTVGICYLTACIAWCRLTPDLKHHSLRVLIGP